MAGRNPVREEYLDGSVARSMVSWPGYLDLTFGWMCLKNIMP